MKNTTIALMLSLVITGCMSVGAKLSAEDKVEIENLHSDEQKNTYLNDLWHQDQSMRGGQEGEVITKYGYDSKEHGEWQRQFSQNDAEVFQKLEHYLITHGYPDHPAAFDELSLNAFPTIIGHHHRFSAQKRLLPYLYDAYQQGHCTLDDVVWVLGEMHESKYIGKRYQMKSSRYTVEDEFRELTEKLDLQLDGVK